MHMSMRMYEHACTSRTPLDSFSWVYGSERLESMTVAQQRMTIELQIEMTEAYQLLRLQVRWWSAECFDTSPE